MIKIFATIANRAIVIFNKESKMDNVQIKEGGTSTILVKLKKNKKIQYKDVRFPDGSFSYVKR